MNPRGLAPGPLLALAIATCALAFTVDHPLVIAALALGAIALVTAAPGQHRLAYAIGTIVAVSTAALNPFVQANGDLILLELPHIPILDTQVTLEEVVAGLVIGAQAFTVTLVVCAVLFASDPDRLLAGARRVAPRSALTTAIAARLVPTLQRDARGLREAAALRGLSLAEGSRRRRAQTAAVLALPLVGSALERSLDVAEAMAARRFGEGPATRLPEPGYGRGDWLRLSLAAAMLGLLVVAVVGGAAGYRFYPTLDVPFAAPAIVCAVGVLAVMGITARSLRR